MSRHSLNGQPLAYHRWRFEISPRSVHMGFVMQDAAFQMFHFSHPLFRIGRMGYLRPASRVSVSPPSKKKRIDRDTKPVQWSRSFGLLEHRLRVKNLLVAWMNVSRFSTPRRTATAEAIPYPRSHVKC
jgi:hypothetical protein